MLRTLVLENTGHSSAWDDDVRDKISRVRAKWMRRFLKVYRGVAHLTSDEIARMIWLMCCDEKDRPVYKEVMRSEPPCWILDEKWKLEPQHKRKRRELLGDSTSNIS